MASRQFIHPQPIVEKIDGGWRINGICYFMGTAEMHILKDKRFNIPQSGIVDFHDLHATCKNDIWYWEYTVTMKGTQ